MGKRGIGEAIGRVAGVVLLASLTQFVIGSDRVNADSPLKGKWNFRARRAWSLDSVGEHVLVQVRSMQVAADGSLYLADIKQTKVHVVGPTGRSVISFGHRGEGPGEFKWVSNCHLIADGVVVADIDKIHHFTRGGRWLEDINPGRMLFPRLFLDRRRLIRIGEIGVIRKEEPVRIELLDVKTGKSTVLDELSGNEGFVEYREKGGDNHLVLKIARATPELLFASDGRFLYHALNVEYRIHRVDYSGRQKLSFSVPDRPRNPVPRAARRRLFDETLAGIDRLPEAVVKEMVSQIPDRSPFFHSLLVDGQGRIFVFLIDFEHPSRQAIDVFSPRGDYLYRGVIDMSADLAWPLVMTASFTRGEFFVFGEDSDGDRYLLKYAIDVPD